MAAASLQRLFPTHNGSRMLLPELARIAGNSVWRNSDWADGELRRLAGKVLSIELWPLTPFVLRISAEGEWESARPEAAAAPDATLRITPRVAVRLAQLPTRPGAALDLTGDPAFVAALRDLHDVLPLALEDHLSALAGPIVAHGVTTALRSMAAWPAQAADRAGAGTAAYLTEEDPLLVSRESFRRFADEVAATAARVERLVAGHLV